MTQIETIWAFQIIASLALCAILIAGTWTELRGKWLPVTLCSLLGIVAVTSLVIVHSTTRWPTL